MNSSTNEDNVIDRGGTDRLAILLPIYNDWAAAAMLLAAIEKLLGKRPETTSVLLVDDGSDESLPEEFAAGLTYFESVRVLRLRRNLGHQRALAVGLAYLYDRWPPCNVVVMDADGQDRPEDIPGLLDASQRNGHGAVVFAKRTRRIESPWFRIGYVCYKAIHYCLTGIQVQVGNFSLIPYSVLRRLVVVSELWNHYAAAVFLARFPIDMVPTSRGARLAGKTRMNAVSLMTHGLAAISVFGERVGARLLAVSGVMLVLMLGGVLMVGVSGAVDSVKFSAWLLAGVLGLWLMIQFFLFAGGALLLILYARDRYKFVPLRDYTWFVLDTVTLLDVAMEKK